MTQHVETEVKYIIADVEAFANTLAQNRARLRADIDEHNIRFDTPTRSLTEVDKVLRLRRNRTDDGTQYVVTVKSPKPDETAQDGIHSRYESEFRIDAPDAFVQAMEQLGYDAVWRYEKHRRVYRLEGVEITLDVTPIGTIAEIEGEAAPITQAVEALGLADEEGISLSYAEIFGRVVERLNLDIENMTFKAFEGVDVPLAVLREVCEA